MINNDESQRQIRQRTGKAGFQLIWSNTLIWWRSKEVGWSSPVGISYLTNMLGTPWSRHTTLVTFCPPFPLPGRLYNKPLELGPAPSYYPSRNGCATKQHDFNFPCTFWKAAALFSFFSEKKAPPILKSPEFGRKFSCFLLCFPLWHHGTVSRRGKTPICELYSSQVPCCLGLAWDCMSFWMSNV